MYPLPELFTFAIIIVIICSDKLSYFKTKVYKAIDDFRFYSVLMFVCLFSYIIVPGLMCFAIFYL